MCRKFMHIVPHRVDDLEICFCAANSHANVAHRVDDLENVPEREKQQSKVVYRIDDLEI